MGCYRSDPSDDDGVSEGRHRTIERRFWVFSAFASVVTTLIALGGAIAAYEAYVATDSQATTARQQLENDEEPALQVVDLRVAHVHEKGNEQQIQINPVIANGGIQSAENVRVQGEPAYCDSKRIPGGFFPVTDVTRPDAPFVVAGKQKISFLIRHQLTMEQQEQVRDGALRPFIYGTLTYDRVFKKPDGTRPGHVVRYCFGLLGLPPEDKIEADGGLTDIYPCGLQTNCADDACGGAPKTALVCPGPPPSPSEKR